jgi:hypothetical protein
MMGYGQKNRDKAAQPQYIPPMKAQERCCSLSGKAVAAKVLQPPKPRARYCLSMMKLGRASAQNMMGYGQKNRDKAAQPQYIPPMKAQEKVFPLELLEREGGRREGVAAAEAAGAVLLVDDEARPVGAGEGLAVLLASATQASAQNMMGYGQKNRDKAAQPQYIPPMKRCCSRRSRGRGTACR